MQENALRLVKQNKYDFEAKLLENDLDLTAFNH